jgi:hypothetical protein
MKLLGMIDISYLNEQALFNMFLCSQAFEIRNSLSRQRETLTNSASGLTSITCMKNWEIADTKMIIIYKINFICCSEYSYAGSINRWNTKEESQRIRHLSSYCWRTCVHNDMVSGIYIIQYLNFNSYFRNCNRWVFLR